jgi:hypothetical protein
MALKNPVMEKIVSKLTAPKTTTPTTTTTSVPKTTSTPAKTTSTSPKMTSIPKKTTSVIIPAFEKAVVEPLKAKSEAKQEQVMGPPAPPTPTFQQYDNEMPIAEYQKYLSNKQSESIVREQNIPEVDVSKFYIDGTKIIPGIVVKAQLNQYAAGEETYRNQLQAEINRTSSFAPATTVSSTTKGFNYNFPYAGAEHYKEYKDVLLKQDLGTKFATGVATALSPQDPLGLKTIY